MIIFYTVFASVHTLFQLIITTLFVRSADWMKTRTDLRLSVLVAARNEEDNILNCLKSLAEQEYPADRFEVWIADDDSTDDTAQIVKDFIKDRPHFHYLKITENFPNIYGKQNAVACIARKAKGDYFLITDADVTHHRRWASLLAEGFSDDSIGVVSAPTIVRPGGLNESLQALDWLMGMATIKAFDAARLPITSVGNNMGVSRQAYEAVGGYEGIPFSVTEDYQLFAAVLAKGYKSRWLFNQKVMNYSAPIVGFTQLLRQRKRWFMGGKSGPWYALAAFGLHAVSVPVAASGFFFLPPWLAGGLFGLKWLADFLLITQAAMVARQTRTLLKYFPLYVFYHSLIALILPFYILWPTKIIWKGRTF